MKKTQSSLRGKTVRLALMALFVAVFVGGVSTYRVQPTLANHPVLVEGNCDSPVPGTTIVDKGTCGDFDGDGRIGTAEDTDGADRIFGTLAAALGPGTGAAAGTGANQNGRVTIVTSGRFAEQLVIGAPVTGLNGGIANPGNVILEAAPGVNATIDAVLQGDPAGGNNTRQGQTGIIINFPDATRNATLRNLTIRNWSEGIRNAANGRVLIDNCKIEGNLNSGVRATEASLTVITNSQIYGNGFRVTTASPNTPTPGDGVRAEGAAQIRISDSTVAHNFGTGVNNTTGGPGYISLYHVSTYFNGVNLAGPIGFNQSDANAQ